MPDLGSRIKDQKKIEIRYNYKIIADLVGVLVRLSRGRSGFLVVSWSSPCFRRNSVVARLMLDALLSPASPGLDWWWGRGGLVVESELL